MGHYISTPSDWLHLLWLLLSICMQETVETWVTDHPWRWEKMKRWKNLQLESWCCDKDILVNVVHWKNEKWRSLSQNRERGKLPQTWEQKKGARRLLEMAVRSGTHMGAICGEGEVFNGEKKIFRTPKPQEPFSFKGQIEEAILIVAQLLCGWFWPSMADHTRHCSWGCSCSFGKCFDLVHDSFVCVLLFG